jgi:phosphinothricin acetyltransferase
MKIEAATQEDLPQIVEIYNQAIKAGQNTADTEVLSIEDRQQWFDSHNEKQYPLLVAKEADVILGYLTISSYRYGRKALKQTAEISYYIHFDHHRKGVASQLMESAINSCSALNLKTLVAILIGCNDASIKLLEKKGFKEWGRMPAIVELDSGDFDHLYYGLHLD